jgi:hypothetical protein
MVEVVIVDTGRAYKYSAPDLPSIVEAVSRDTRLPATDILLFNFKGQFIHSNKPLDPEVRKLFLFRRLAVEISTNLTKRDWKTDFFNFYSITTYDNKFVFEEYDSFPEHYQRIPFIEAELFSLASSARQAYAQYMTSLEYIDKLSNLLKARVEASAILLKNLKHYYREVKRSIEGFSKDLKSFQTEAGDAVLSFNHSMNLLNSEEIEQSTGAQCSAGELESFKHSFSGALASLDKKCWTLRIKTLPQIKDQLKKNLDSLEIRGAAFEDFLSNYRKFNAEQKEAQFIESLAAMEEYANFRDKLEMILIPRVQNPTQIAQSLLNEDKLQELRLINFADLQGIISQLQDFERLAKENETRIIDFYQQKAVKFCVEIAQKLKYQANQKVTKMRGKLEKLKAEKETLYLPIRYKEGAREAMAEIERRKQLDQVACGLYAELCRLVVAEVSQRQEFIEAHGDIWPSEAYPELSAPVFSQSNLQYLTRVEADPLLREPLVVDSATLVTQYKLELRMLEESCRQRLDTTANTNLSLEHDLDSLSQSLRTTKAENEGLRETILNYKTELSLLRQVSGGSVSRRLQAEINRLADTEESFKRAHMEEINQLREDNKRLRAQLEGCGSPKLN